MVINRKEKVLRFYYKKQETRNLLYIAKEQDFMHKLIDFLQIHPNEPSFWPSF
jgi:hypothetical protein